MMDVITQTGTLIRGQFDTPEKLASLDAAVTALGGIAAMISTSTEQDTVLSIIGQQVVGTVLTDADGNEYDLQWDGIWFHNGLPIEIPPYEFIVSATMPGGWSWSR